MVFLTLILGLFLLVFGGDLLVRGASKIAAASGLSPLVIGLTVVAFGTSAPELAVSVQAAFNEKSSLALGNVVGSNIFNILFILGVSAVIVPLSVHRRMVTREVPIVIVSSLALLGMGLDGKISLLDGGLLCLGFLGFVGFTFFSSKETKKTENPVDNQLDQKLDMERTAAKKALPLSALTVLAGLAVLVWGSDLLVESAVTLARGWGVRELVIGLTIVAAGTSLPEVAASIIAAIKGERDMAIGNVVGSNIFNILLVLGLSSVVAPAGIEVPRGALSFDIPVLVGVSFACLPFFYIGYTIERWQGFVFLGYYVAYTAYLVFDAQSHPARQILVDSLRYFALPLTVLTLGVLTYRQWQRQPPKEPGPNATV